MAVEVITEKGISKIKGKRIWRKLKKEIEYFPLRWETLTAVELIGEIEGGIQACLIFGTGENEFHVHITDIHVHEKTFEIMQLGSSYGNLIF